MRAGFASLSASSFLNSSTPYTPSSTSSAPSNAPASLKQALEKSGQSGSAQWSDDGNSLTVTPNAVRSSGIARSVIGGKPISDPFSSSDSTNGPVYSLYGNRIGSDGSLTGGGNAITPVPIFEAFTPPLVSSEPSGSSNLISILSEQNDILRAGFASLAASSSVDSSAPYTPSFDSPPFPSTVSPALKKAIVDAGLVSTADVVNSGIDYLLGKKPSSSSSGYKPISDPFSSDGPVYSLNGNRIGSDGSLTGGGNAITPRPIFEAFTPPLVSSEPSGSSSLISILSEQNEILRAGLASLSASSSLNSSAPYTPSFDSSPFPSTVSPALKKAIVDAGLVSTAEWSPDGNSLTIKGNTVRSTDIGDSVYAGSPISSYDSISSYKLYK